MSDPARYYTNQRLNAEFEDAFTHTVPSEFDTNTGRNPLDLQHLDGLTPAIGAMSLPPQGKYSSMINVTGDDEPTQPNTRYPLYAVAALAALYLGLVPM